MKKVLLMILLLSISSCGSLKVTALGCRNQGDWGGSLEEVRNGHEIKVTQIYYIWNEDQEVRIKDILKKNRIDCLDVKKIWVDVKMKYLVKRELTLHILK